MPNGDGKIARPTSNSDQIGVGEDLDVGVPVEVEESGGDGWTRAAVAVIGGTPTENAVVGREHIPQLRHPSTDPGHVLDQIDLQSCLGEVDGGPHPADPTTDDQHCSDALIVLVHAASYNLITSQLYTLVNLGEETQPPARVQRRQVGCGKG